MSPMRALEAALLVFAFANACGEGSLGGSPASDSGTADATTADAGPRPRVLFIGNSYTYVNDLPGTVRALGDATPGAALDVDQAVAPSTSLSDHWNDPPTVARIAMGGWSAVVLQGQSLEPLNDSVPFHVYAGLLAGAVTDAGARPVWYATWARRPGDPIYAPDSGFTPQVMTQELEDAYRAAAKDFGGVVARVGAAWQIALAEQPSIELYAADGSHPSPAGTILTACVMLEALTAKSPRLPDPPPLGVPAPDATALCAIADRVK